MTGKPRRKPNRPKKRLDEAESGEHALNDVDEFMLYFNLQPICRTGEKCEDDCGACLLKDLKFRQEDGFVRVKMLTRKAYRTWLKLNGEVML